MLLMRLTMNSYVVACSGAHEWMLMLLLTMLLLMRLTMNMLLLMLLLLLPWLGLIHDETVREELLY